LGNLKHFLNPWWVFNKLVEHGFITSLNIIWYKIRSRTFSFINSILHIGTKQSDTLYAFYDLEVSPPTFDFIIFLILAERARVKARCGSLHIVVVPGPNQGFRMTDLESINSAASIEYDNSHLHWRKNNIVISCCTLLPSIGGVTTCNSRGEAHAFASSIAKHIFPNYYSVASPIASYQEYIIVNTTGILPTLESGDEPKKIINNWIELNAKGKKVITITLRESFYEMERNSNLTDWENFARNLDKESFFPVFIRDTEAVFNTLPKELEGLMVFNEICFNMELRAALYELSYLNMFVNNGPTNMARFLKGSRSLVFKMITPECGATTERHFRVMGVEPGSQYQPLSPYHKLVWENDDYDVLLKEFKKMSTLISHSEQN